ncbi:hypothetical protein DFH28DRAFT_929604 [Melampsora americana]|nr:hypothetical protein DFH28DRAFT_929604 [Melampsora americana]
MTSVQRNCQNESHQANYLLWLGCSIIAPGPQIAESGHDLNVNIELLSTPMVDLDGKDDLKECQQTILELWSQNHTSVFENADCMPNLFARISDSDIGHNPESEDSDVDECEIENPNVTHGDSDCAPFSSLEFLRQHDVGGFGQQQIVRIPVTKSMM